MKSPNTVERSKHDPEAATPLSAIRHMAKAAMNGMNIPTKS